jgi:hypothetical protein
MEHDMLADACVGRMWAASESIVDRVSWGYCRRCGFCGMMRLVS